MSRDSGWIEAQALWWVGPRTAQLRWESIPPPGPGQVRVRAIASAVSQGTELLVRRGEVPPDLPLDLPTLSGSFAFPIKYGYASVGRVIDVGDGVGTFRAGDLVFAHHPHQSVYTVPASLPRCLPPALADPLAGLFIANLEAAVNVLLDTPLRLGETAIVFGQGTVGLLIDQLLKRAGAARVIGVDPLERRRELARRVGADAALAPAEGLPERVRALTGGRGADVAIEASGNGAALQAAIESLADEGTAVVISWYGTKPVQLELGGRFHRGRIRLLSSQVGRLNPALAPRWDHARRMDLVVDLLPRLHLLELVSHRIPFARAAEAFRLLEERPGEAVQVVLTYDSAPEAPDV